ncbi:MAG TPA: DNA alkylation repair protein [Bacteroidales bacterium]|nr:DNA alkylation repair protein [Bacteroidales bacterium]
MSHSIVQTIRNSFASMQNEAIQMSNCRFFKEPIQTYGIRSLDIEKIAKQYKTHIQKCNKQIVFDICKDLWHSGYIEEGFVACHFTQYIQKKLDADDMYIFSEWIDTYISNWATCDTFCNHTIGDLLQNFPEILPHIKQWVHSNNMWKRRASAVSLILPARRGLYKETVFEIAEILLHDSEDLVQKGYGWMLKETSKPYCNDVFNFIMKHKHSMPRTALRYAIEKMPPELRSKAMEK